MSIPALSEWKVTSGLDLTEAQVGVLRTTFKTDVWPEFGGGALTWAVRPGSTIGTVAVDGDQIVVRPKVPIRNVLFLLDVGAGRDPVEALRDAALADRSELTGAVAGLFAGLVERALAQGVLRAYRTVEEDRASLRGRIDLAEQLRRRPGRMLPIAVRYDEHDEDVLENQLLLAAARTLLRMRSTAPAHPRLRRIVAALDDVTPVEFPRPVPEVGWTRLNVRYRPAVELARVVLAGEGVDLDRGSREALGLTLDMNKVFEDFVARSIGDALAAFGGRASGQDAGWRLDEAGRVVLRPDLIWYDRGGRPAAVIDAKYKVPGDSRVPEADIYQVLAYSTALRLPEAHLVYADGVVRPPVTVRYGGPTIHTHALDLSAAPVALLAQTAEIARRIRAGATPRH